MKEYFVVFEKVNDSDFPDDYYYAHVPSLGLTTHGMGIEGARKQMEDLLKIWDDNNLSIPTDVQYSKIEI